MGKSMEAQPHPDLFFQPPLPFLPPAQAAFALSSTKPRRSLKTAGAFKFLSLCTCWSLHREGSHSPLVNLQIHIHSSRLSLTGNTKFNSAVLMPTDGRLIPTKKWTKFGIAKSIRAGTEPGGHTSSICPFIEEEAEAPRGWMASPSPEAHWGLIPGIMAPNTVLFAWHFNPPAVFLTKQIFINCYVHVFDSVHSYFKSPYIAPMIMSENL